MTDLTTPTVPIDLVHAHEHNPRRLAVADEEMVASVRAQGIAQAVTIMPNLTPCAVHPDETCYRLGAGHRRTDAATKAGLTELPVVYRDDLVTESQQIEFMLVENLHREDLTAVEEAEAYEQLTLQGMDAAAIAAATGRKASTVKARLNLNGLAVTAREKLHAGEMTLLDAESMLEFADDPATTAELEAAIGTTNFRWTVENARRARARAEARAAQVAALQETGAAEVDELRDGTQKAVRYLPEDLQDPATHDGCLGYVVPESGWQDPYLVCTDLTRHPLLEPAAAPEPVESEWEKRRAEREEAAARHQAAAAVRVDWLRDHFGGMFPTKSHGPLAKVAQALMPLLIIDAREAVDSGTLMAALGSDVEATDYAGRQLAQDTYAAGLRTANPTTVLRAFGGYLAALVADQLGTDPQWIDNETEALFHLNLWDWLKAAGYPLSDVDKEIRTALEVKHTELAEAAAAEAS